MPRARSLLERAAELAPTDGSIYPLLTRILAQLGEPELAARAEWLAKVHDTPLLPRDPPLDAMRRLAANSHALAAAGRDLAERGDLLAAEAQLRKVLAIRPGTPLDFGNLATVLSRQGRHAEAMEFFAQGLAGNPDDVVLLSHQGLTQMKMGDVESAEASLERATTIDPSYPQAQFNLGVLRYGQGRHQDAIALFERTLDLDPGFTDAYLNLGSTHAALEDYQAALDPWERLRQAQPNNAALIHNIALGQRAPRKTRRGDRRLRTRPSNSIRGTPPAVGNSSGSANGTLRPNRMAKARRGRACPVPLPADPSERGHYCLG